jgi:hypothetical protein
MGVAANVGWVKSKLLRKLEVEHLINENTYIVIKFWVKILCQTHLYDCFEHNVDDSPVTPSRSNNGIRVDERLFTSKVFPTKWSSSVST